MFLRFNRLPTVRYSDTAFGDNTSVMVANGYRALLLPLDFKSTSSLFGSASLSAGCTANFTAESSFYAVILRPLEAEANIISSAKMYNEPLRVRYVNHYEMPYGLFNHTMFNRHFTHSGSISGVSSFSAKMIVDVGIATSLNGCAFFIADNYRIQKPSLQFIAHSSAHLEARAVKCTVSTFNGASKFYIEALSAAIDFLEITGLSFKPGDVIEINLCNFYATQNNVNIMDKFTGNFFKFYSGDNILIWQDNVTARTVEAKIRFQNKFL